MKNIITVFMVVCFSCLLATTSFAREQYPYYLSVPSKPKAVESKVLNPDTLIFSGGGASGVAYAGVLRYLEDNGKLKNVKRYMGASAGAIFSFIFYLGITADETDVIIEGIDWPSLLECKDNIPLLKIIDDFFSFTTLKYSHAIFKALRNYYGLSDGKNIEKMLRSIIMKRRLSKDGKITFAELKKQISKLEGKEKDLYVVAFSTSYNKTCFLSAETTPDMDVVDAIRASMAIPFVYTPVIYSGSGKNDYLVDGGTTYNYPIEYFDTIGAKSLGFVLYSADEYFAPKYKKITKFNDQFIRVLLGLYGNVMPRMANNVYRTVFVDTPNVGTLSFDMTPAQRKEAMQQGYTAAQSYFESLK